MHPYREPGIHPEPPATIPQEEKFLIWLLLVLGLIRVIPAISFGEPLLTEPTLALLGIAIGLWWGARAYRRYRRGTR